MLFEHFFTYVKVHAKLLDKYHNNRNSPYYHTCRNDRIKFHNEEADDLDQIIKQEYVIMITSVSEVESGVINLQKRGKSNGRIDFPNFGQVLKMILEILSQRK